MNRDMLHLAERLVIAVETMSQDVKNMSQYIYDLSCSVSYLLNEKRVRECLSVVAYDEDDNSPNASSAAAQEASVEGEYSVQYAQAADRSSSHIADSERRESSFGGIASTSIDPQNNLVFTEWLKTEEQPDGEVDDESCDMEDTYVNRENTDRVYTTRKSRLPEEQAETPQIESAEGASVVHTKVNSEERRYKCSMCGKSFNAPSDLQKHTRVHTGERPYKCNICGSAFSQSGSLSHHLLTHSGERPYSCNVCEKAFNRKNHLTVHMRSHTGENPYKCNLCGKEFRHSKSLNYHIHTHSREDPS